MDFHDKKLIGSSPLAIHKPPPIPEISRLSLPVILLLYRRFLAPPAVIGWFFRQL